MELVERYLAAIKFWLPKTKQDDIIAEISEDLRSQIEDEEGKLGRTAGEREVAAILKRRGRPLVVAGRYLPQHYLIGPTLFPAYRFVLAIAVVCYSLPQLLVRLGLLAFDPDYRATHTWIGEMSHVWPDFPLEILVAVGAVTCVFAVLERVQVKSGFLDNWDPLRLRRVRDPNRITRLDSFLQLAANAIFAIWWVSDMWSQILFDHEGIRVVLAPVWKSFLWAFLLIALANIALACFNLVRRYWTLPTALLRLALDTAGAVAMCGLLRAKLLLEISAPKLTAARAAQVTYTLNTVMGRLFPVAVVACVLTVVISNGIRLARLGGKPGQLCGGKPGQL